MSDKKTIIKNILEKGVTNCIERESLEKKLNWDKKLRIKLGIDPTGTVIHLGHAVPILKLAEFQKLWHQIIIVIGDATAQVGDTSDKESERPMLTREETLENAKNYIEMFRKILDIDKVEIRYNSEWLDKLNFCEIGEIAKNFSVREMLDRDMFAKRFGSGARISLQEFLYPLMQGYDSVAIEADVELGWNDQLFNLLAGRPIQEQYGREKQDILTFELIEWTDGRKMSKTYKNFIGLDEAANDMFVKLMEVNDELILTYYTNCTDMYLDEIEEIKQRLNGGEHPRTIKLELAHKITSIYHGEKEADHAQKYFEDSISWGLRPSDEDIAVRTLASGELPIVTIIRQIGMVSNSTEARNALGSGGVKVDEEVVQDPKTMIEITSQKKLIQVGKKKFGYIVAK